ncbi:hypothetical protein BJ508DRAFT_302324 [Ascobolus immersus RN42]|uniref:Uncharacterized protein n=1 Tax=Ascobolus immersus RN42 TaxID=1160509 RepID=A0A3N4IMK4_ASCIM|nr:hypothetical protein BJ508DRAFT_302324 [Ascobolus immersus RN42]
MTSAFATECLPTSPPPSYTLDTLISEAYPPTPTTPNTPYYPTESLETKHKHASFKTTLTNILTLLVFFKNPTSKSSKSKTPSPSPSKKPSRLFRRSSKEQPRNNSTTSTKHLSPSESTAYWNTVCDPSGRLTPEPFGRLTPSPEPFTSDRLSPEPFLSSPYSGERPGSRFSMRSKTQALCPPQTPSSRHSTSSNVLSLHAFAEPISPPPSPPPPSKRSRNDLPRRDSTIHGPNPEEDEIVAFDSLSIYSKFPSPPHTSPLSMLPPMPPPSGSLPPLPTDLSSSKSLKRKRIEVKKIEHVEPEVEEEDGEDIHPFFWAPY